MICYWNVHNFNLLCSRRFTDTFHFVYLFKMHTLNMGVLSLRNETIQICHLTILALEIINTFGVCCPWLAIPKILVSVRILVQTITATKLTLAFPYYTLLLPWSCLQILWGTELLLFFTTTKTVTRIPSVFKQSGSESDCGGWQ